MRVFYIILFVLFNVNGLQEIKAQPVEQSSVDKAFVVQGITTGIQGQVVDLELEPVTGRIPSYNTRVLQGSIPIVGHMVSGPFISMKLKRQLHFRSHPDDYLIS